MQPSSHSLELNLGQSGYSMLADVKLLSSVHTGDNVEFNTVDFVGSRLCRFGPVHTDNKVDRIGNKVKRIGNKVDRDKLSNSRCCRFVAKTGNKVERIRQQSTLLPICCRFRQQSTFNKVDRFQFNFVTSVFQALCLLL